MIFYEAVCTQCGKEIYPPIPSEWAYKREGNLFFCSWRCLCEYDRIHDYDRGNVAEPKQSYYLTSSRHLTKKQLLKRNAEIIELAKAGKSYGELALMYNLCPERIRGIVCGKRGEKRK